MDYLTINSEFEKTITQMLLQSGLSLEDIEVILKGGYYRFENKEEDARKLLLSNFNPDEFMEVLEELSDGYSLEELTTKLGIKDEKISAFKSFLKKNSIALESCLAFHQYTVDSKMILDAKRGIPREEILTKILSNFHSRMEEYRFPKEQIDLYENYVKTLDYSLPLHENYRLTKEFLAPYQLRSGSIALIQNFVKSLNRYYHLDQTLMDLDRGIQNSLPMSMKLFRAVQGSFLNRIFDQSPLSSRTVKVEEKGYSSTSLSYDSSFAKYFNHDVVFEIYVPMGTQGILISPFSSYFEEQEILLNSNDLYIFEVLPNYLDKKQNVKTVYKGLLLSKDKSCYIGIHDAKRLDENPAKMRI